MVDSFSESTDSESFLNQLRDFFSNGISHLCGVESEPRLELKPKQIEVPVLQNFKLYETPSDFYLVGRDEKKSFWRILKIDRKNRNGLDITEDSISYTEKAIGEWIIQMNKEPGGFRVIATCYGIIGFVRFLEPYYMLVITKRKKVGEICGHTVYAIAESKMIPIPHPTIQTNVATSKAENKYKKLLSIVNLSKNFYFSYTYHLMYSLQKNVCSTERGIFHDNTMFVWNAFLTRGITKSLQNTKWTVALVYGFFQQTKCLVSKEEFVFTIIARRSRHYAGTRYLRRGVNRLGRVANDVETEQIVSKVVPEGQKIPITSVVQVRGSIPLNWSQEGSFFKPQPEIKLNKQDANYEASHHHFDNLKQRYGNRIMILNLLKTGEKRNRETLLWEEFAKTIKIINKVRDNEDRLKAIHYDLSMEYKKGVHVAFDHLCIFAREALKLTDMFFCKAPSGVGAEGVISDSFFNNNPLPSQDKEASSPENEALKPDIWKHQNGVLRTNCVDCLDRTNFAQYAQGLVALEHQLLTLGISGPPVVDVNNPLALELMDTYQKMGDTLAMQYGGSEAHSKMFDDLRGNWKIVGRPRDMMVAVVRHINNTSQDKEKQNAINVFLGHFHPQLGKPQVWELDSDQHNIGKHSSNSDFENIRPLLTRSLSGNILPEDDLNLEEQVPENPQPSDEGLNNRVISGTSLNRAISRTNLNRAISGTNLNRAISGTNLNRATSGTNLNRAISGTNLSRAISGTNLNRASMSFLSAMDNGETGQSQGSSSSYYSYIPNETPGFAHSYDAKFIPAEDTNASFDIEVESKWSRFIPWFLKCIY